MDKDQLCPYTSECSFYNGKIEDDARPRFFVLNVFCRGGQRGWTGCQRYQAYVKGLQPDDELLPKSAGTTSDIEAKVFKDGSQS